MAKVTLVFTRPGKQYDQKNADALGTTRTLSGLDRPDINTAPFNINEGVTNTNSFRNMLLDDLRNLPSDLRTS